MPGTVVVGAQWGDEGKGKVVDLLSGTQTSSPATKAVPTPATPSCTGRSRFCTSFPPASSMRKICVIGNGVVIDPPHLVGEIAALREAASRCDGRFLISHNAHLIMPYHKQLDGAGEQIRQRQDRHHRTRHRPAYIDKAMRNGIRIVDLLDEGTFREKLERNLEEKNIYPRSILKEPDLNRGDLRRVSPPR